MPRRQSCSDVARRDPTAHTPQKRNTWHATISTEAVKVDAADILRGLEIQEPATCLSSLSTSESDIQNDIASASDPPDNRHSAERDIEGTAVTAKSCNLFQQFR
jgi:hypothetical protein